MGARSLGGKQVGAVVQEKSEGEMQPDQKVKSGRLRAYQPRGKLGVGSFSFFSPLSLMFSLVCISSLSEGETQPQTGPSGTRMSHVSATSERAPLFRR